MTNKKYFRIRSVYRTSSVSFDIRGYIDGFERIKVKIGVRRRIRFAFLEVCDAPLTLGFLSPVIVFPEEMKKKYCRSFIDWSEYREEKYSPVPLKFTGSKPKKVIERRVSEMK